MKLEQEIREIFIDYINDNQFDKKKLEGFFFNTESIENLFIKLYYRYRKEPSETDGNIPDITTEKNKVFEVKPFDLKYGRDNFWLKANKLKYILNPGEVLAFKDGVLEVFRPGEYLDAGEIYDTEIVTNTKRTEVLNDYYSFIHVYFPNKIRKSTNSHFNMHYGKSITNIRFLPGIRIYFNFSLDLTVDTIEGFLKENLIEWLNDRKIPFQLKTPYVYRDFKRADNCVLYLAQMHYWLVFEKLKEIKSKHSNLFRNELPFFVKPIFDTNPGIGIAEDPILSSEFSQDGMESFGENRIKTILSKIKNGLTTNQNYSITNLISDLEKDGYNTEEFYRNPNTNFNYNFPIPDRIAIKLVSGISQKLLYMSFNREALEIALKLVNKAHVFGDTINWIGVNADGSHSYLQEKEKKIVLLFLDCVSRVSINNKYFNRSILSIIASYSLYSVKNIPILLNSDYVEKLKTLFIDYDLINYETFSENFKVSKNKLFSFWKNIFNTTPLEDEFVIRLSSTGFSEESTKQIVTQIYNAYAKIDYPMKNRFGNYDFDPISLVNIGFIFLFTYCPALIPKN